MKTFSSKKNQIKRDWFVIDADQKILGRIATKIAKYLRGKHKTIYTPHVDTGDYIIVINAKKVSVTGNKRKNKIYHHHTGYIGGIKSIAFEKLIISHPIRIIEKAVKGMLPKNNLGRDMYKKLKVYENELHPHTAQNPQVLEI